MLVNFYSQRPASA